MTIQEAIKESSQKFPKSIVIPTDEYGKWNINIVFINSESREDETQFDVKPALFDYINGKCDELVELWKEFCKDNGFKQNSVEKIYFANL